MSDLHTLFEAIDRLADDELKQVHQHIEQRRQELRRDKINSETVEERIAAINKAVAEFREGLTEEELNEIFEAMSSKYISPKERGQRGQ